MDGRVGSLNLAPSWNTDRLTLTTWGVPCGGAPAYGVYAWGGAPAYGVYGWGGAPA